MTSLTTVTPTPQGFGVTERRDPWWLRPSATITAFVLFLIYGTWAAFQAPLNEIGPYITPFESPNLYHLFPSIFPPDFKVAGLVMTPAMLVLWGPGAFRFTCYFCRLTYYRSFMGDPPSCAVGEWKRNYRGEKGFFAVNNLHRYFLYIIFIFVIFHWLHFAQSFWWRGKGPGIGVGTLVTGFDTIALTMYVGSCHALRHLVGGGWNRFPEGSVRYKLWRLVSKVNEHHGLWFWVSLGSVAFADLYMRLLAHGVIHDYNTWGGL